MTTRPNDGAPFKGSDRASRARPQPAVEDLASLISHEVKTPLAVVAAAAEALQSMVGDDPEIAELTRVVHRNAKLALLLVDRLRLARDVEGDDVDLTLEEVDLAELLRESVSDLREVVLHEHPTVVNAPESLLLSADPTAVREIVLNLLANAAKYSDVAAPIELRLEREHDDAVVVVRNHGSGITPGDTERIFEPYEQLNPDSAGVGLGLYVSRGLARAHGGEISVSPAAQRGSEFIVRLPLDGPTPTEDERSRVDDVSAAAPRTREPDPACASAGRAQVA